jgi:hypothetical protein
VADTKRVLRNLEPSENDLDLVEMLLTSRSDAEAVMAYSLLRQTLPDQALIALANLREIIAELPESPFCSGTGMEVLESVGGYEATGHSYRRMFEGDHGVFGIEFIGEGTRCDGIAIHTESSRFYLRGDERSRVDHLMLEVIVFYPELLDSILEGLQLLGVVLEPFIYLTTSDFPAEHAASAAGQAAHDLF